MTNLLDNFLQEQFGAGAKTYLKVSGWKLIIFGLVLILMMRFRPEGLLPETRHQRELHPEREEAEGEAAARAEVEGNAGGDAPKPSS